MICSAKNSASCHCVMPLDFPGTRVISFVNHPVLGASDSSSVMDWMKTTFQTGMAVTDARRCVCTQCHRPVHLKMANMINAMHRACAKGET